MPSKIRLLSEQTINKIAAGEVIEQPASVVKELVENSLDAKATKIEIDTQSGGRQLIRVTDDGEGMGPDDALMCLERHATSKVKEIDDLFQLTTLGFRGEALPSIASISKFSLLTRPKEKNEGTFVLVEGGKHLLKKSVACQEGSVIEVKELFYNVPARKHFQKAPASDFNEILKVISGFALGRLDVSLTLRHEGKAALQCSKIQGSFEEKLKERIDQVLGKGVGEQGAFFSIKKDDYCLRGWVSLPTLTRRNRTGQFLFVNERQVVSLAISYAIKESFGTMIPTDRHPLFVLFLEVPKEAVDANVHPQKREVRLRHEGLIKELCLKVAEKALSGGQIFKEQVEEAPFASLSLNFNSLKEEEEKRTDRFCLFSSPFSQRLSEVKTEDVPKSLPISPPSLPKIIGAIPGYFFIDRHPHEAKEGLFAIDQSRMQASVFFLSTKQQNNPSQSSQLLLLPLSMELSVMDASFLADQLSFFSSLGFSIRPFGPNTYLVEAIPCHLEKEDAEMAILSLLEAQKKEGKEFTSIQWKQRRKRLPEEVAINLFKEWIAKGSPKFCPKGEKIIAEITSDLLDKFF